MTQSSTLTQKGHVEVGLKRQNTPTKLYYELHGNGPEKVALIMGLSTPCGAWDYQIQFFVENGYSVLVFDNRGMGYSEAPLGLYSTSQMAQDALEVLDHVGWTSNVNLVGVSMGGMISLELVYAAPERFQSLTLTSTAAKRNIPNLPAIACLVKMILFCKDVKDQASPAVDLVFPKEWLVQKPKSTTEYVTNRDLAIGRFLKNFSSAPRQTIYGHLGQTAACLGHYVSDERLKKIGQSGISILIVTGTIDNLVRTEYSHHLKKVMKEARMEVFEGSGHAIPEEQPEKYNHLLLDHFHSSKQKSKSY